MWIRKKRQKTGNMCNIPLLNPAKEILDRYKSHPACIDRGVLLPMLCNQKYNAYLKELATICGINKEISSHTARHSFATSVALANGVSIENVAKMLGHSDTKMTRHYARVLDKSIMRDMAVVNSKFSDQPTPATPPISESVAPAIQQESIRPSAPTAPSTDIPIFIPHPRSGVLN